MKEGLVQLEKRVDQQNLNLVMWFSLVLMWKALLKVITETIKDLPSNTIVHHSDPWLYNCYY